MSNKNFYKAFEDKYRGTREVIKERLEVYLQFILPLKEIYPNSVALDIGCGRGEWLELLQENGFEAQGVDSDEGMLNVCHELKLNALQGDGIRYLQEYKDESVTVISAFHVVEHISFEDLQILVQEALRVLKPGGLLILETPNPENIKVASESFYLDPTHLKPLPSALLSFLPEFYGFARNKIIRLQESKDLINQEYINLMQIIEGVSPDYAVVAQKNADLKILKLLDKIFDQDFGLSLHLLSEKFENRLQSLEARINEVEAKADEALVLKHKIQNSIPWKVYKYFRDLLK